MTDYTQEFEIHFERRSRNRQKALRPGRRQPCFAPSRIPRISRLVALAHRLDGLRNDGTFETYADLAAAGKVSRARITQIISLLSLAPDIQEELLFLPTFRSGRDRVPLHLLLPIAAVLDWGKQRRIWKVLREKIGL